MGKSTLVAALVGHLRGLRGERRRARRRPVEPVHPRRRCSATASAWPTTSSTPRSSSARWAPAGTWAASRRPPSSPCCVLDAAGKDVVLVETVGVGQSEVEVARSSTSWRSSCSPAPATPSRPSRPGVMEIPDVICHQQARPSGGCRRCAPSCTTRWPRRARAPAARSSRPTPRAGEGIDELWDALRAVVDRLGDDGLAERRRENLAARCGRSPSPRRAPASTPALADDAGDRRRAPRTARARSPAAVAELRGAGGAQGRR